MKLIKRLSDNVVVYAGDDLTLTPESASGAGWQDFNTTTANAVVDNGALPADWSGGAWSYVGSVWTLVSQAALAEMQSGLLAKLESQRIAFLSNGLHYTFPDGSVSVIQIRDPAQFPDILNINSYTLMATVAASQGATTMPVGFIDAGNVTHAMTPVQAITMGVAVSAFVGATYAAKQAIRAAINALTATSITTFDITQGW